MGRAGTLLLHDALFCLGLLATCGGPCCCCLALPSPCLHRRPLCLPHLNTVMSLPAGVSWSRVQPAVMGPMSSRPSRASGPSWLRSTRRSPFSARKRCRRGRHRGNGGQRSACGRRACLAHEACHARPESLGSPSALTEQKPHCCLPQNKGARAHLCDVGPKDHAHPTRHVGLEARLPHRVAPQHVCRQPRGAQAVWVHAALVGAPQVVQPAQRGVVQAWGGGGEAVQRWSGRRRTAGWRACLTQLLRKATAHECRCCCFCCCSVPPPSAVTHQTAAAACASACACRRCAAAGGGTARRAAPACAAPRAPTAAATRKSACRRRTRAVRTGGEGRQAWVRRSTSEWHSRLQHTASSSP